MASREDLWSMVTGFRLSAVLAVAADLGVSDELHSSARSAADLAAAVGADPETLLEAGLVR